MGCDNIDLYSLQASGVRFPSVRAFDLALALNGKKCITTPLRFSTSASFIGHTMARFGGARAGNPDFLVANRFHVVRRS